MVAQSMINALLLGLSSAGPARPTTSQKGAYVDWRRFHANGVNLGGWLAQESNIDPYWWDQYCGAAADEWTCCVNLGAQCGPVFEQRYATYITTKDIDKLAAGGVTLLRIPTTYAAWVKFPGVGYYSGNQARYFKKIADYAIQGYGMHIVLDLHSLPGGINGLDIGERFGHWDWFNNQTNLARSLQVVDTAIKFIQNSGSPQSYSFAPINEPADNPDLSKFGSPAALSDNGAAWVLKFFNTVIARVEAVNRKIPIMLQGSFKGEPFWSGYFSPSSNIVFDEHNYYFARPSDSNNVTTLLCADAKTLAGDGKFPTFVGEWAMQTLGNNTFANRAKNLNTGLYAYNKYTRGSAYWTAKSFGNVTVAGEGTRKDYWNYETFIDLGIVNQRQGQLYCS